MNRRKQATLTDLRNAYQLALDTFNDNRDCQYGFTLRDYWPECIAIVLSDSRENE